MKSHKINFHGYEIISLVIKKYNIRISHNTTLKHILSTTNTVSIVYHILKILLFSFGQTVLSNGHILSSGIMVAALRFIHSNWHVTLYAKDGIT